MEYKDANTAWMDESQLRSYINHAARQFNPSPLREGAQEDRDWLIDPDLSRWDAERIEICDYETRARHNQPRFTEGRKVIAIRYLEDEDKITFPFPIWGGQVWEDHPERVEPMPIGAVLARAEVMAGSWIATRIYKGEKRGPLRFKRVTGDALERGWELLERGIWRTNDRAQEL